MKKNKEKVVVSSKVDSDLKDYLQAICKETEKSRSELIRDALQQTYGKKNNPNSVRSMARRVGALERDLEQLVATLQKLERKLNFLVSLSIEDIEDVEAG